MWENRRVPCISPFCLVDDEIKDAPYPCIFLFCRFVTVTLTGQSFLPSVHGQVQLDKVASQRVRIFGTIICLSFCFDVYLFLSYLLSNYLHLTPIPATRNSSKGPGKVKGLSAPGKLARQHDSCGKIVPKKQVSCAERLVSFVSSGTMAESVTETIAVFSSRGDASLEKVCSTWFQLLVTEPHRRMLLKAYLPS
jgi:G patch domain-containing protein 2